MFKDKEGAQALNEPHYNDGTASESNSGKASVDLVPHSTPTARRKSVWYEAKGDLCGSANAGTPRCVHFQYYRGGTPIRDLHFSQTLKRKTPVRASLSNISLKKTVVFVPLLSIWDDAYKWESQQSDAFTGPVTDMPSITVDSSFGQGSTNTYKPKLLNSSFLDLSLNSQAVNYGSNHVVNLLIPRAQKISYNYIFRPKQDIAPYIEYRDTIPTAGEVSHYASLTDPENQYRRSAQRSNYVNSYRYNLQVGGSSLTPSDNQAQHTNWQLQRAELLRQANNQEKSDIEILSEFYGTAMPTENRPLVIGQKTVSLSDTLIAQSASTSEDHLGVDGATSTFIDDEPLMNGFFSPVSGYILVFYEFQTEPIMIGARARESFLTSYSDYFRKDLLAVKDDVMYLNEVYGQLQPGALVGWKRKFSEVSRLPSTFIGDCVDTWNNSSSVAIRSELKLWLTNLVLGPTPTGTKIDFSDYPIQQQSVDNGDPGVSTSEQFWFVGTKYCRFAFDEHDANELALNKWGEE